MSTPQHHPIALRLPRVAPLLIVFARQIVQAMTGNPWFPSPTPDLATVAAAIDALDESEVLVRTRVKGAAAARNVKKKEVERALRALKRHVEGIADQDVSNGAAIIESAGMTPKKHTPRHKLPLSARMGTAPDQVILRAKSLRRPASYEWQYSDDGGETCIGAGTTTVADTIVRGLSPARTYCFRFRTTVKRTTGEWSQVIHFVVH
jgi:hypothetical protein